MSQYITACNTPIICGVESCNNDAYVTLYVPDHAWIGICPSCLDELHRLQSDVTLPEQRGHVIDLHVTRMGRAEPLPMESEERQAPTSTGDAQKLLDRWGLKQ